MHIWVDADACPGVIKDILFRAAERTKIPLTLIANRLLRVPTAPHIRALQVPMGFDVADRHIVQVAVAGDLVITADIPLAAALVKKNVWVLDPRGELYDAENIGQRLALRDWMEERRAAGEATIGPAALSPSDRQAFARQLDRLLARHQ